MTPNSKLRSKTLKTNELDKVHGGTNVKGSACGADYHCNNCGHAWLQSQGIYCPICAKTNLPLY